MLSPYQGRIHIDVGSGDGRGPYRWARRDPDRLFLASDTNGAALRATAFRAARKPARGGVGNLLCIAAPLRELSDAVSAAASSVSVVLPWGDLLDTIAGRSEDGLRALAGLAQPGRRVEAVFSYDHQRDAAGPRLVLDAGYVRGHVRHAWEAAGLRVESIDTIDSGTLRTYKTTWSKRLAFGRPRIVWRLRATAES